MTYADRATKPIVMNFFNPMKELLIPTAAYEIVYSKRWGWLQRICYRIMLRTKALAPAVLVCW